MTEDPHGILEINSFRGDYQFLSNFYERPFDWDGMTWRSSEHAFQAAKAEPGDKVARMAIKMAGTPAIAKKMGRQVKMRADWDDVKVGIMRDIVRAKFSDPYLAQQLLATGSAELIEGNTWGDKIWGCVLENGEWEGRNMLGRILMEVRSEMEKTNGKK